MELIDEGLKKLDLVVLASADGGMARVVGELTSHSMSRVACSDACKNYACHHNKLF